MNYQLFSSFLFFINIIKYWCVKKNKVLGKFYEIHRKNDNKVYIHYGPEPLGPWSLPIGKLEEYIFNNSDDAKKFMKKKIDEKLKKKYEVEEIHGSKSSESKIFKWMLKNAKPIVKNKTMKKMCKIVK